MLDLWAGLFVAAGIVALLILALKVGNASTTFNVGQSYQLVGRFENIGGLKVRAPVKSAGVVVGRVADIQFDNTAYAARVTMNVDQRYKVPRDTTASILTSGLLGEQYIGLEGGGDEKMLNSGEMIKLTQSAVVLIGVDEGAFWSQMQSAVDFRQDIVNGIIKSVTFGVAVTAIALFEGYDAPPTAEGVSGATTRTVVTSSLAILGLDFVLTAFMFTGV